MTTLSPDILKACDIRGVYPKPLGAPQAEQIALALGTLVKDDSNRNIKVVVGYDVRNSSGKLHQVLLHGLKSTGLKVVDAGLVSTPLLAFAARFSGSAVGVMVTASHNPPEYNGFKFFPRGVPASIDWMERFYAALRDQRFRKGAGVVERKDFYSDYRNSLVNTIAQNFQGLKVVVDVGNGAAALTAPDVLKALHFDVEMMNAKPNGRFPGRGADSSEPKALETLGEQVRKSRARLGIAFDGDGDRASFVDESGAESPNDVVLSLFAADLLKHHRNAKVVFDAKCSDCVEKTVRAEGGTPVLERPGHSYIFSRMQKEKALLGGEASGHFFLPGSFPGDALYACLRLLKLLKEKGKSLGELYHAFPRRVSTHDVKFGLPPGEREPFYEALRARAEEIGGVLSLVDGVRAVFEEGWGIVRSSVTEDCVSFRLEASTTTQLRTLAAEWFRDFPEVRQRIFEKIQ